MQTRPTEESSRNDPRPLVVYIAGSGRSGSTLLERILGAQEGCVNVGEVLELFRKVSVTGERCGCGRPFDECPFWREVGERAFGGWSKTQMQEIAHLQRQVGRQRHFGRLIAGAVAESVFSRNLNRLGKTYNQLYEAIAATAGARTVIDASKWPAHALALARSGKVDVRIIHLVRDARGVAYSWSKSDVARPHHSVAGGGASYMATHPVERTAVRWTAFQLECEALSRSVPYRTRLRYEDLVRRPGPALDRVMDDLNIDINGARQRLKGNSVMLAASHGLAGNPSRFTTGRVDLRLDENWRKSMPAHARRTVTTLSLPVLLGYGYVGLRAVGARE